MRDKETGREEVKEGRGNKGREVVRGEKDPAVTDVRRRVSVFITCLSLKP